MQQMMMMVMTMGQMCEACCFRARVVLRSLVQFLMGQIPQIDFKYLLHGRAL